MWNIVTDNIPYRMQYLFYRTTFSAASIDNTNIIAACSSYGKDRQIFYVNEVSDNTAISPYFNRITAECFFKECANYALHTGVGLTLAVWIRCS